MTSNRMKNRIQKFIAKDKKGRLFMEVIDKVETSEILKENKKRYCPPHRLPHTVLGEIVADEPCHIHTTRWRYYTHHLPYCLLTACSHAKDMREARDIYFSSPPAENLDLISCQLSS